MPRTPRGADLWSSRFRNQADRPGQAFHAGSIESGDITARLPSLKAITQEYGVSHITAEKAVALLRDEGLVVVVIGRGAYVRKDRT